MDVFRKAISFINHRGGFDFLSDELYLKLIYWQKMGKKLNLKNPKRFNEKLQWLKLHDRKPEYSVMVDKYEVKNFVTSKIGSAYVIPTLGVWDKFEDIDFGELLDKFVLKCTHDSGGLVICKDKNKLDMKAAKTKINKSLQNNYYLQGREWPYKNVKPRILAEKYMVDESGFELKDYKVMCFEGEPKLIQVHSGRFASHTQDFYTTEWEHLAITQGVPLSDIQVERPACLQEMLEMSRILAAGLHQVRVDWYYVEGQLYFGEITFFDASGFDDFEPDEWNELVGSWIKISV